MKTHAVKADEIRKDWFVVDAEGKTLGRLATEIARGKGGVEVRCRGRLGGELEPVRARQAIITLPLGGAGVRSPS